MPVDVIQKIYANNAIRNGSAVVGCSKEGDIYSLPPVKNQGVPASGLVQRLDIRFDDPTLLYSLIMVILSQDIFDLYYSFADDFISDNFGINCVLQYSPIDRPCANCIYDSKSRKSSNIYKTGGPYPFTGGICPYCNGRGMKQEAHTETIKMRVYWSKKFWLPIPAPVNVTDGTIQTIGFMTDVPKIKKAEFAIINSDLQNINSWQYQLASEMIPYGFNNIDIS